LRIIFFFQLFSKDSQNSTKYCAFVKNYKHRNDINFFPFSKFSTKEGWKIIKPFIKIVRKVCFVFLCVLCKHTKSLLWNSTYYFSLKFCFRVWYCTFHYLPCLVLYIPLLSVSGTVHSITFRVWYCTFHYLPCLVLYIPLPSVSSTVHSITFRVWYCTFHYLPCLVLYIPLPQWFSLLIYWHKKLNYFIIFNVTFSDVETIVLVYDDWINELRRSSKNNVTANAENLTEKTAYSQRSTALF
jgi:hypothetical protein